MKRKLTIWGKLLPVLLLTAGMVPLEGSAQSGRSPQTWSAADFTADDSVLTLNYLWHFKGGDSLRWASPSYDDRHWEQASTYLGPAQLPFLDWNGTGWFRTRIKVDSTLVNYPLSLVLTQHNGASEIYLDGELIYRLGEISPYEEDYRPYRDSRPRPIVLSDTSTHLLAVRYVNHHAQRYLDKGYSAGFRLLLGDLESQLRQGSGGSDHSYRLELFFGGILLAFTIIHFLLYLFYPNENRNLYFALFTVSLALMTYLSFTLDQTHSPLLVMEYARFHAIAWLFTVIFALRFAYSLFYSRLPRQFWVFLALSVVLATGVWWGNREWDRYRDLFVLLVLGEIARILVVSFYKKREGVWIIGSGMTCFAGGILYTSLANMNIIPADPLYGGVYGAILLIFAMSVFLSRDFARTQKRLEHKLIEVKQLSERSLEQERINKEKELERKLLEAENERKSRELEKARALQLSMLPRNIPENKYWDIAVFMETAQEVGGDYYDFSMKKNGRMTVALGDATGHGMKAGIIVATAKSYFHTLADNNDNLNMLRRISSGIRNMDLKLLYMGMLLMTCRKHEVELSSAGMPPVLVWRSSEERVDDIVIKGLPLGTRVDYPYESRRLKLSSGDTLLLMSDGLMELFNENRELLGIDRIRKTFGEVADTSASNILARLTQLIEQWAGGESHEDDITLLVMKAK